MPGNDYTFHTHWSVPGTVAEVADVLFDPADLPRWWPSVYIDVRKGAEGDEHGIGSAFDLYTTGWLPYTLRWRMRVDSHDRPHRSAFSAAGDLTGGGEWQLRQDGDRVSVDFQWSVRADKPILRFGSPVLRPVFAANHNWAMAKGLRSLELELARRRATTAEERAAVAAPPGRSASGPLLVGLAALVLLALRRRRQT